MLSSAFFSLRCAQFLSTFVLSARLLSGIRSVVLLALLFGLILCLLAGLDLLGRRSSCLSSDIRCIVGHNGSDDKGGNKGLHGLFIQII